MSKTFEEYVAEMAQDLHKRVVLLEQRVEQLTEEIDQLYLRLDEKESDDDNPFQTLD
ncbi:MAG: hypothetical protein ACRDCT_25490 [Shewanella sp.]